MATPEKNLSTSARTTAQPGADPNLLARYSHGERLAHWGVAIAYVLLFLSGLALFHPFFYWTSALFGGGSLMRVLHPFLGVALALLFYPYAARLWRDNRMTADDWGWVRNMLAYVNKRWEVTAGTGKFNAGQKLMYWSMMAIIAVLVLSGIVLWQPYFAPAFSPAVRKLAAVLHAASAFVMFVGIGVHVIGLLAHAGLRPALQTYFEGVRGLPDGVWERGVCPWCGGAVSRFRHQHD